jgi:hypothetical protein
VAFSPRIHHPGTAVPPMSGIGHHRYRAGDVEVEAWLPLRKSCWMIRPGKGYAGKDSWEIRESFQQVRDGSIPLHKFK